MPKKHKLPGVLRLISDGTAYGSRFYDRNGDPVDLCVERVTYDLSVEGKTARMQVVLNTLLTNADVEGPAEYLLRLPGETVPKAIRRIEFADGSSLEISI
jgi:hypothetical protein